MVITCENIRFITRGLTATHDKSNIFTHDNHNHTQYFQIFSASHITPTYEKREKSLTSELIHILKPHLF